MVDYLNVIQVGVAMILIIAIGFILTKLKIISPYQSSALNNMTLKVGFLPLMARGMASKDIASLNFIPFCIAALMSAGTYLVMSLMMIIPFKDRFGTYLSVILSCTYINYVISGLPVFNALWPPEENIMVSLMTASNDIITSPIYLTLVGIYNVQQENKRRKAENLPPEKFSFKIIGGVFLNLAKNPILIGNILGIIYSAIPIGYPLFLQWLLQFMGDIVLALSLLCVGNFLAQHSLMSCSWWQFILCVLTRFFVGPTIAAVFCYALGLDARLSRQCIIIGAQPTAVGCYALTSTSHLGQDVASTCIFWTIVLTVPVVIIWFTILDGLGIFVEE